MFRNLINKILGPKHRHRLVTGLGMFGDALTCVDCGYSKYPESALSSTLYWSEYLPETPENLKLANEAIRRKELRDVG